MAANADASQIITRLTPLNEVLAMLDLGVKPVAPRTIDVVAAAGRTLAGDATVPARPNAPIALIDGWAVGAEETVGAGSYAPVLLVRAPQRIEAGQPLPPDTDSVAPVDAMKLSRGQAEALATVNPGNGVLPAGGDCDPATPLRLAGERLRATDLAAFAAAGLSRITVREPRIHVLPVRGNAIINAAAKLLVTEIERQGGVARLEIGRDLGLALAAENADGIVIIGGTGSGRNDSSVQTLAREGELSVHGVALTPGETAALGFIGPHPVLVLPGRLDAALAVWLTIGRQMLARLAGGDDAELASAATLVRKIASPVGLTEFVPVRRTGELAEPLAAKYLPLSALVRADGWLLVPPDSEGYPEGAKVAVRAWPQ